MNKPKYILILLVIALGFMLIFYRAVIFNPNLYLFSDSGDGIKNYYTYYYHLVHDTSYINFGGMNYPYGEHFLYTDGHPVLSALFKLLNGGGFFTQNAIGILNLMMMLSVFLTFFMVYLVLIELRIKTWMAVLFSVGITMLAPQIFRLGGHFALSYSVAIPLTWLLMIRYVKASRKVVAMLGLTLSNLFWLFIHAYLGMILLSFQFAFFMIFFLVDKNFRRSTINYLNLFVMMLLPVLLFYFFMSATDTHEGRTDNPSGFFLYNAEFDDVFIPHHPPLRPVLDSIVGPVINLKWEAWSYVGLATTLVFLTLFILSIISIFSKQRRKKLAVYFSNRILMLSLLAAFVVLLFAMAFPFKLFPQLLDLFPVFKQFRATGRFAWVFYFVATAFSVWVFQLISERSKQKGKGYIGLTIVVLAATTMIFEALPYHLQTAKKIVAAPNQFSAQHLKPDYQNAITSIQTDQFQAILPLPFYYQGSEMFARPRHDEIMRASMIFSAHTGLPMFSANLTRTAIPESKKIIQLMSPTFYEKPIRLDLLSDKPVLILSTDSLLTPYEKQILARAVPLFSSESIRLYRINVEDLFRSTAETRVSEFKSRKPHLMTHGHFLVSDTGAFVYFNDFDDRPANITFRGEGAYTGTKRGKNILAEFNPGTFEAGKTYALSCWMYNGYQDALNLHFQLRVEMFNESTGEWNSVVYFPEHSEVINGNWSLAEMEFKVGNPANRVYIVTKGKADAKPPFAADDLLIREKGTDVYRMDALQKILFYNNHEIKF